jgi:hypothetical protein
MAGPAEVFAVVFGEESEHRAGIVQRGKHVKGTDGFDVTF